jgi:hypothetical protein
MAYYIFLKSLRKSLELFGNISRSRCIQIHSSPHSCLPKILCNFLGIFPQIFLPPEYLYSISNPILIHKSIRIDFLLLYLISAGEMVSARPPPLFSSPAATHLLPPCLAQSAHRCSACPFRPSPAPLVHFGRHLLCLSDSAVASLSLTGGPTLSVSPASSPSSDNACAATALRPPSVAQLHASGATGPLPPRLHFPSLKSRLKPSPVFNGVKAINAGVKLPGHPSPSLPRPPIKGEHPHRVSPHLSPLLFPSLHA